MDLADILQRRCWGFEGWPTPSGWVSEANKKLLHSLTHFREARGYDNACGYGGASCRCATHPVGVGHPTCVRRGCFMDDRWFDYFDAREDALRAEGLSRELKLRGTGVVSFASNDY